MDKVAEQEYKEIINEIIEILVENKISREEFTRVISNSIVEVYNKNPLTITKVEVVYY